MNIKRTEIDGVFICELVAKKDERGSLTRLFCDHELKEAGLGINIVQINHSYTSRKGTFRGIHLQIEQGAEYKCITCIKGSVNDYAVDLRKGSSTLFKSIQVELSENKRSLLILPPGVGHAFYTLTDNVELIYFHSNLYSPLYDKGVRFSDPLINIQLESEVSVISERDMNHPLINNNFLGFNV